MTKHTEQTYVNEADKMYSGDEFEDCAFTGTIRDSNLADAVFTGCTFSEGAKFVHCLMVNVAGAEAAVKEGCNYCTPEEWTSLNKNVNIMGRRVMPRRE